MHVDPPVPHCGAPRSGRRPGSLLLLAHTCAVNTTTRRPRAPSRPTDATVHCVSKPDVDLCTYPCQDTTLVCIMHLHTSCSMNPPIVRWPLTARRGIQLPLYFLNLAENEPCVAKRTRLDDATSPLRCSSLVLLRSTETRPGFHNIWSEWRRIKLVSSHAGSIHHATLRIASMVCLAVSLQRYRTPTALSIARDRWRGRCGGGRK
jgi:hypothetical protein